MGLATSQVTKHLFVAFPSQYYKLTALYVNVFQTTEAIF